MLALGVPLPTVVPAMPVLRTDIHTSLHPESSTPTPSPVPKAHPPIVGPAPPAPATFPVHEKSPAFLLHSQSPLPLPSPAPAPRLSPHLPGELPVPPAPRPYRLQV